ncbi:MAG: PD-(D/E)XK nuclease family protein, partial [Candidatus Marisimplicoccus sp.]
DVTYDLVNFGLFIDKESNRYQVEYFKKKDLKFFSQIRKKIIVLFYKKTKYIHDLSNDTLDLINQSRLNEKDFKGGYFPKYLKKLKSQSKFNINESSEKSLKGESNLYNKTLEKNKVDIIEKIRPSLLENYLKIKKLIIEIDKITSTLSFIPSISLISRIEDKVDKIQNENKVRLISKFNTQLNALIKLNDAPYIYEKLGSIFVDFFIDEFQDTSELQWENLIPLISNSIHSEDHDGSKGSLLIVGDPKQSIYRWRGGKFNQFLHLIHNQKNPFHLKRILDDKEDINYRSCKEIVDFNSEFFTFLSNNLDLEIYNSDDLNFRQKPHRQETGYVSIDMCNNESFFSKIENQILDLLNRGYSPSEIVILVRKHKHAKELIEKINTSEFDFISSDILQINNSDNVQFIISIFKLSLFGNDYAERKKVINYLYNHNFFENNHNNLNQCFSSNLSKIKINDFFLKISNNEKFELKHFLSLNILNAIKYCGYIFKLDIEDPFIVALIDNIFEFLDNNDDSIKSYLNYWEKKSENIMLSMPDNQNSISISTIHKSKGLEYPAVIIPIYNDKLDENLSKDLIWLDDPFENLKDLKWTLMRTSKNLRNMGENAKEIYDRSILNNLIDSVNLLYVAFTRAEKELFIISKKDNSETNSSSTLVKDFLTYKSSLDKYTIGEKLIISKKSRPKYDSNNLGNKIINIRSTSKNVNQAKYVSDTLSKIYDKDKYAKVYVFFANEKLLNLINIYDYNQNLKISSNHHILELGSLDYDYVIITNMNEGFFPFSNINENVIEESEKINFDNKSQYEQENNIHDLFYDLIHKAKEVHLIYDSDLSSLMSGEASRFIKQIEFSGLYNYNEEVIKSKKIIKNIDSEIIKKDDLINQRIHDILKKGISASTLNLFIKNPYLFYQQKILGINDYDESNYLNFKDQGTLFHTVMDKAYSPYINKIFKVEYFNEIIKKLDTISMESYMELNSNSPEGKDIIFIEVLKKCIINILNFERELVEKGNKIKILSLENKMTAMIKVNNNADVLLTGTIDRIDTFNNNLRIIDYKSGKIETNYLKFKDFEILKDNHKYSNMLQLLFYKLLVSKKHQYVNEIGLCYFKKNNNPYEFIKNSEEIEISKIENFIREIIESILEKESFIDSGNPA